MWVIRLKDKDLYYQGISLTTDTLYYGDKVTAMRFEPSPVLRLLLFSGEIWERIEEV